MQTASPGGISIRTSDKEPARDGTRFPCFDGLRALAALLVIGVHTAFVSGLTGRGLGRYAARMEIGVSVFFVISGFLLYRPFAVAHFRQEPETPARHFWARRLRRIVPAYWLAFILITYVLHADTIRHGWGSVAIYLGFAQIYSSHHVLSGITQAWSLCTEMSFYLFLPLYAAWLGGRRWPTVTTAPPRVPHRPRQRQLRAELLGLLTLVAVSFGFRIWPLEHHSPLATIMPNWLPGYLDVFALGMLLAVLSAWLATTDQRPSLLWHPAVPYASWAMAAVAFIGVSNLGLPLTPVTPSPLGLSLARQTLYGLFAFFVVLPAVFGPQDRSLVRGLLRARPVALLGVVSFGIYLWHESWIELFLRWTKDPLFTIPPWQLVAFVTAGAVVAATLSYVVVERPILRRTLTLRRLGRLSGLDRLSGLGRLSWLGRLKPQRRPTAGTEPTQPADQASPTAAPAHATLVAQP